MGLGVRSRPRAADVDPAVYKKTVKLLKSSKLEKVLRGCALAMDVQFVRDRGATSLS